MGKTKQTNKTIHALNTTPSLYILCHTCEHMRNQKYIIDTRPTATTHVRQLLTVDLDLKVAQPDQSAVLRWKQVVPLGFSRSGERLPIVTD